MKTRPVSKKETKPLKPYTFQRLDRAASIARMAEDVFESKEIAASWLATPNEALGGASPARQCETEQGAQQVRRVLNAIECGGVV